VTIAFRLALALAPLLFAAADSSAAPDVVHARPCESILFEATRFTVCAARPGEHEIALVDKGKDGQPLRDFDRAAADLGPAKAGRVAFAMNAGMFDTSGLPIGLYVEQRRQQKALNTRDGPGNFHMKPNGVFFGDDKGWGVLATDDFAKRAPGMLDFATQSGPMLVVAGAMHPKFSADGASVQIRNGVGVAGDGVAWFAISDEPVSFGRFARLFRDRLHCPDALFLDGVISRLWEPGAGRRDAGPPLGPMVVVLETAQPRTSGQR
jgi:uncharacterized protein YigE (DUF2233 family)